MCCKLRLWLFSLKNENKWKSISYQNMCSLHRCSSAWIPVFWNKTWMTKKATDIVNITDKRCIMLVFMIIKSWNVCDCLTKVYKTLLHLKQLNTEQMGTCSGVFKLTTCFPIQDLLQTLLSLWNPYYTNGHLVWSMYIPCLTTGDLLHTPFFRLVSERVA